MYLQRANYECTFGNIKVNGVISARLPISSGVMQGWAIGPLAFVLNAGDLQAAIPENKLHKYATNETTFLSPPTAVKPLQANLIK